MRSTLQVGLSCNLSGWRGPRSGRDRPGGARFGVTWGQWGLRPGHCCHAERVPPGRCQPLRGLQLVHQHLVHLAAARDLQTPCSSKGHVHDHLLRLRDRQTLCHQEMGCDQLTCRTPCAVAICSHGPRMSFSGAASIISISRARSASPNAALRNAKAGVQSQYPLGHRVPCNLRCPR